MTMDKWTIILPVGSVMVLFGLRIKELLTRRNTVSGQKKETLTLRLFLLMGTIVLVCAGAEFIWLRRGIVWPVFVAGWVTGALSFLVRRRAIEALGKFWSLHVEIRDNHQFVQTGPFRWMRHPAYFSMILELIACTLILHAWYSMALIVVLYLPVLCMRLRIEERALVEKFGNAYLKYQQSTPALFPLRWPTSH